MIKHYLKKILSPFGIDIKRIIQVISKGSVYSSLKENKLSKLVERLRLIVPDISKQESRKAEFNNYWELKRRALQAFQCSLMLRTLKLLPARKLTVVDIGDSAGNHMIYLRELTKGRFDIDSVSVNLDTRAIEKIKANGLKAVLCRAEELDLGEKHIDLFTSFEMVEHLHNPSSFFRRMAKRSKGNRMVITVPYMKKSRVGLYHIRKKSDETIFAEDEHIFELSPEDWTLLIIHSGWRVVHNEVYYQYPRKWPIIREILAWYWKRRDFEGFWGAILEKDTAYSDRYQDWE